MNKYTYPNYVDLNLSREFEIQNKRDALKVANVELARLVDFDMVSQQYLHQLNDSWFYVKEKNILDDPDNSFTSEECLAFADALEDIARRALQHAKEIREAKYLGFNDMPEEVQQKFWDAWDEEKRRMRYPNVN